MWTCRWCRSAGLWCDQDWHDVPVGSDVLVSARLWAIIVSPHVLCLCFTLLPRPLHPSIFRQNRDCMDSVVRRELLYVHSQMGNVCWGDAEDFPDVFGEPWQVRHLRPRHVPAGSGQLRFFAQCFVAHEMQTHREQRVCTVSVPCTYSIRLVRHFQANVTHRCLTTPCGLTLLDFLCPE